MSNRAPQETLSRPGRYADLARARAHSNTGLFGKVKNVDGFIGCVEPVLKRKGYPWLKYVIGGGDSDLYDTTENQYVRMCLNHHIGAERDHPAVLHPIDRFEIEVKDHMRKILDNDNPVLVVSVMSRVRTDGVTGAHQYDLNAVLNESGLNAEIHSGNVGLIDIPKHDALPVLLDSGGLEYDPAEDRSDKTLIHRWRSPEGKAWQNIYDPRIGTGKPTGIIPEDKLHELRQARGADSLIVRALEQGGYGEHVRHALENESAISLRR